MKKLVSFKQNKLGCPLAHIKHSYFYSVCFKALPPGVAQIVLFVRIIHQKTKKVINRISAGLDNIKDKASEISSEAVVVRCQREPS